MLAAQPNNSSESDRESDAEDVPDVSQSQRIPFQDLRLPAAASLDTDEVDSATMLERRTIGRTLEQLSDAIVETRMKFDTFDKFNKASTSAMNGPFLEGAAWFCGGLASMVAIQEFAVPLTPQLPFYLAMGIGAARFFWRLAKEARPSGIVATAAKERYNASFSRKTNLARSALRALQVETQKDEYGIEQEDDIVGVVLKSSLQYVTPLLPHLEKDNGQMKESVVSCGERLSRVIVPYNSKRKAQLEEIFNGYSSDRARLIRAIGRFLQNPERNPPVTITRALSQLSQHATSLDAILVEKTSNNR